MSKRLVSNFFLFIFTVFIAAPTVISVVEKSYDVSIFFNVNEEENKVNETVKLFEVKLNENDKFHFSFLDIEKEKTYASYLKTYAPSTIECISPPPEFI
jgi:hypothetical protein